MYELGGIVIELVDVSLAFSEYDRIKNLGI